MENCASSQFKDAHIFMSGISLFQQHFNRNYRQSYCTAFHHSLTNEINQFLQTCSQKYQSGINV